MPVRGPPFSALPRLSDSWTFLYVERCHVEKDGSAIVLVDEHGRVPVPIAALAALFLGPGTTITHAAMVGAADNGASVVWAGEGVCRCYASSIGETNRSANLMAQARAWADPSAHLDVVRRMYAMRFTDAVPDDATLETIRGMEGARVRTAYARASAETGVAWKARQNRGDWAHTDPVNRAISAANACLYGVAHAAIVTAGYSPGLGFVHTGKALSFVYDIADLYKTEATIPVAFQVAAGNPKELASLVRRTCRESFRTSRLLERMIPDIQACLGLGAGPSVTALSHPEDDEAIGALWDPVEGEIPGGKNFAPAGYTLDPDEEGSA